MKNIILKTGLISLGFPTVTGCMLASELKTINTLGAQVLNDGSVVSFNKMRQNGSNTYDEAIIEITKPDGTVVTKARSGHLTSIYSDPNSDMVLSLFKNNNKTPGRVELYKEGELMSSYSGEPTVVDFATQSKRMLIGAKRRDKKNDAFEEGVITVIDNHGEVIKEWKLGKVQRDTSDEPHEPYGHQISQDGKIVYLAPLDDGLGSLKSIKAFTVEDGPNKDLLEVNINGNISSFEMINDDRFYALVDGRVIGNVSSAREDYWIGTSRTGHPFNILRVSANGKWVLAKDSAHKCFTVWNSETGEAVLEWNQHSKTVKALKPLEKRYPEYRQTDKKLMTAFNQVDFAGNDFLIYNIPQKKINKNDKSKVLRYVVNLNKVNKNPKKYLIDDRGNNLGGNIPFRMKNTLKQKIVKRNNNNKMSVENLLKDID